jgi:CRP-like cAMP-binding protein
MNPLTVVHSVPSPAARQVSNRLLAALPLADFQRLLPDLIYRPLKLKQVLHKNRDRVLDVYFPDRSVCSLVSHMDDGSSVEVAMVGDEGLVGIGAVLGEGFACGDAVVQMPGNGAYSMTIEVFDREMARRGAFYDVVTKYAQVFVAMLIQSVACNGLHTAEERACRWLLMVSDRLGRNELNATHELLSILLGVRRPTVTLVLAQLVKAGMISQVRGSMRIVDRQLLEAASCECYGSVKRMVDRLM